MFNSLANVKLPLETTLQRTIGQEQYISYLNLIGDGIDGLIKWEKETRKAIDGKRIDAITIFNANPMTIGHRYLAELASKRCSNLLVLVIQGRPESGSKGNHESTGLEFPFERRLAMTEATLKDISNITVLPSGPYIISRIDYPTGFLCETIGPAPAHAELDSMVFCHVCKSLGIKLAFFGDEPRDELSEIHLNALRQACAQNSITLKVAERKRIGEKYISSALARQAIADRNMDELNNLIPQKAFPFLNL